MAGGAAKEAHPYARLADSAYWRQAVSEPSPADIDPLVDPVFTISPGDRVATAGSCFAQHISKRLRASGYNYFIAEPPAAGVDGERLGFYDFSARYGNVYTSRQLVQLFDRAFGYFVPRERVWTRPGGGYCDPFRPRIEPDGFPDREAVLRDADRHLEAVRRMFLELDVFVFTLGLTECWRSRLDGAAYPLAPGVAGGQYDPAVHEFVNLGVGDVVADMDDFLRKLRLVNPGARVVLTVSPVPLVATYEKRHVLASTVYSKSVLRVAAEEVARGHDNVQYFPSYEIIVGPHAGGRYFEQDRRGVTQAGVDHVMKVFMSRMTAQAAAGHQPEPAKPLRGIEELQEIRTMIEASCDEEMYAKPPGDGGRG
ncbi:GSCFA domain-containing protein [Luteimonas wenzhouensis]|uniref:GSCFA domain-containing protein n=2 Tax=Luteimonas wenzhouensis TaxID=2599615 RepID=A0A5C5TTF3_9GAMM|nr:GSCFA domain-containing protein [Luteimonas wenzhouensis]